MDNHLIIIISLLLYSRKNRLTYQLNRYTNYQKNTPLKPCQNFTTWPLLINKFSPPKLTLFLVNADEYSLSQNYAFSPPADTYITHDTLGKRKSPVMGGKNYFNPEKNHKTTKPRKDITISTTSSRQIILHFASYHKFSRHT